VFVASVAYSVEEADIIYNAAHKLGFKLKAHLWELEHDNSRELLEKYPFVSVDHLEFAQKEDLEVCLCSRYGACASTSYSLAPWLQHTQNL